MTLIRLCPNCSKSITYTTNSHFLAANRRNAICRSCTKRGKRNPHFGKPMSKEIKQKMRDGLKKLLTNKIWVVERNKRISATLKGRKQTAEHRLNNSRSQRKYSNESKYSADQQRNHFRQWLLEHNNGFEQYIGLSYLEFKTWIQVKFKKGMTWENYSWHTWHIDHKHPLCRFDLTNEEQINLAWNYRNLTPLWQKENFSKGSRVLTK